MDNAALLETARRVRLLAMQMHLNAVKTTGTYQRQVWRVIRELYNAEIDEYAFVDDMAVFIDNQFGRAWREGARDMGVQPNQFTIEDFDILAARISSEQGYMLQLADDVMRARQNQTGIDQFRGRADMWANRYNDIVNEAHIHFAGRRMLEWRMGDAEHCESCLRLNGTVASGDDWAASGIRPQSHDLECNGYNCRCSLEPTDKAPTGPIPWP